MRGRVLDPAGKGVGGALIVIAPAGRRVGVRPDAERRRAFHRAARWPSERRRDLIRFAPQFKPGSKCRPMDGRVVVLRGGSRPERFVRSCTGTVIPRRGSASLGNRCRCFRERRRSTAIRRNRPVRTVCTYRCSTDIVSMIGRRDVPTAEAVVTDGAETEVVLEVP